MMLMNSAGSNTWFDRTQQGHSNIVTNITVVNLSDTPPFILHSSTESDSVILYTLILMSYSLSMLHASSC